MANSVSCTISGNCFHGRCAKIIRVISRFKMSLVCSSYRKMMEGMVNLIEKLCDEVETVHCIYLGDKLNTRGNCKAATTAKEKNRLGEMQKMWSYYLEISFKNRKESLS